MSSPFLPKIKLYQIMQKRLYHFGTKSASPKQPLTIRVNQSFALSQNPDSHLILYECSPLFQKVTRLSSRPNRHLLSTSWGAECQRSVLAPASVA